VLHAQMERADVRVYVADDGVPWTEEARAAADRLLVESKRGSFITQLCTRDPQVAGGFRGTNVFRTEDAIEDLVGLLARRFRLPRRTELDIRSTDVHQGTCEDVRLGADPPPDLDRTLRQRQPPEQVAIAREESAHIDERPAQLQGVDAGLGVEHGDRAHAVAARVAGFLRERVVAREQEQRWHETG